MDRISHLPEEIIVKILTFLLTKDVMRTMVLSKRWKSLWRLVPRLEFDEVTHFPSSKFVGATRPDYGNFRRFVDRSLMSRAGQVLQSLSLRLNRNSKPDDVEIWLGTAVKLGLKELKLQHHELCISFGVKSLFTCETLVVLRLDNCSLDVPDHVCLRSLKTLSLVSMRYSNPNALLTLLPNCPVLEDLFLQQRSFLPGPLNYKFIVPSLKRLSLIVLNKGSTEVVIDTPSLKSLQILDRSGSFSLSEPMNISEVLKANIDVILKRPEKLLHSLASVVNIRLCLSDSEVVYPDGCCFHRLKHLEVCTCKSEWLLLFMRLLQDSPVLKVIKINQCHPAINPRPQHWNQPATVPRFLSSNLEIFEWIKYEGTQYEKELSTYILKNAVFLKKASFTASSDDYKEKLQMLQELSLSPRASSTYFVFQLKFSQAVDLLDIGVWITIAVKCSVRDMSVEIDCSYSKTPLILPRSLFIGSGMLVSLKLKSVTLMGISTLPSFPALKTLSLVYVKYPGDEFVRRFLSCCHVLEDLVVEQCLNDNVTIFTIKVPSLKSASLYKPLKTSTEGEDGFVIDAPSLEYLGIFYNAVGFCVIEDMPNIVKADAVAYHSSTGLTLNSITSAKRLFICLPNSEDAYSVGTVFHRLVHLRICTCETEWLNLLMRLLSDSPNLRYLKLQKCHDSDSTRPCWKDPSSVPECLLSSLETLEWVGYEGSKEEKEVATFMLRNGRRLNKVTISSTSTDSKKLEMLRELSLSFRRSPTCQLVFD